MTGKGKKITEKFWLDDEEKLKRLVSLLKNEIERIIFDVEFRKEVLFKLWSKERVRDPLLKVLQTRFFELGFGNLILLPRKLEKKVEDFYRSLDEFIFYVTYTEDMPVTMKTKFEGYVKELKSKSAVVLKEIAALSLDDEI